MKKEKPIVIMKKLTYSEMMDRIDQLQKQLDSARLLLENVSIYLEHNNFKSTNTDITKGCFDSHIRCWLKEHEASK